MDDKEEKVNQDKTSNQRRHPRIAWSFMVRFKQHNLPGAKWELSTLRDVSESGCFFYSSTPYETGDLLDVEIQLPTVSDYMHFTGEIKRCDPDQKRHIPRYGVAVQFAGLDEVKRGNFLGALDFLLKRQTKKE